MSEEVFNSMLGKTMVSVTGSVGGYEMVFKSDDGKVFTFEHYQDCCEHVAIEEVIGDINDLVGSPITMAEKVSSESADQTVEGTWTFYKYATNKGYVTVRWLGVSNGYYSESVSFSETG